MTPEVLHSLTAAHGLPMPNEDAKSVDKLAELFRRERRLRDLVRRLKLGGDIGDEQIATMARYFGCAAAATNTRSTRAPQWSHAECAMAGQGMADRHWLAMRYTYALDDTAFGYLSLWLWEWALEKREREKWPQRIVTLAGVEARYMRTLVDMWLLQVRAPWRFHRTPTDPRPGLHRVIMNVSEPVWSKRLSPIYAAIGHEFEIWLAIAHGHMAHRLREEADE